MLGGFLWSLTAILHSAEPQGCIGVECTIMPVQETTDLVDILTPTAALLVLAGLAGLVVLVRHEGRLGRAGAAGVAAGAAGLAVLLTAGIAAAVFVSDDLPWMPLLVVPGILATVVGFFLIGVAVLRSGVLPRWSGAILIVGSLILLAANEQTAAVLFSVPFGLAWIAVGHQMWSWKSPSGSHLPAIDSPA